MENIQNNITVDTVVDTTMEELRAKVTKDILEELEKAGATVVKSNYDGFLELVKVLKKFDNYVNEYKEEVDRINARYSNDVALQKRRELDVDLLSEKSSTGLSLDLIVGKEDKYKREAIANNLKSAYYREARKEAIDILIPFGAKLDEETTLEFIKPCIEAKDLGILKALKETSNEKTRYLYTTAIKNIENYLSTTYLERCIRDARVYVGDPINKKKSYILECLIHEYASK